VGRILMSIIFLLSCLMKIKGFAMMSHMISDKGLPAASLLLVLALLCELAGGLALLTGFHARDGALLLFLYLIPVTLLMHNFWAAAPDQAQMQTVNFLKNLTIMGGLLIAWSTAPESRTFRVGR
jgi:putative oxidoreductase